MTKYPVSEYAANWYIKTLEKYCLEPSGLAWVDEYIPQIQEAIDMHKRIANGEIFNDEQLERLSLSLSSTKPNVFSFSILAGNTFNSQLVLK
jgi:hypothetical protein